MPSSIPTGVWHYVVINRKDNGVGRDTYDEWCPEKVELQEHTQVVWVKISLLKLMYICHKI